MSEQTNPKKELWASRGGKGYVSAIADVWSPIAEEIKDPELMKYSVWGAYKYVPFLEGGDASFAFFSRMRAMSPTHGGCIHSIGEYSFGGGLTITRKSDGFARVREEVSTQEQEQFIDWIKSWTSGTELLSHIYATYQSYKTFGNAYLEVVKTTVAGQTFFQYKAHSADRVRFMQNADNNAYAAQRYVWISPEFNPVYLAKYVPDLVPVYPIWSEENGTQRTIIQLKRPVIERDWYGEPDSIESLFYQYLEYQQGRYTVDAYANDFIGKVLIEAESMGDDIEQIKAFDKALQNTFTNKGHDKKSVVFRARPAETKETKVHQFNPNTNEKFHKEMGNIAEHQIIKSHDWHPILFMKTPGAMGGSQEFREVFKVKNVSVIQPIQNKILSPYRKMLDIVANEMGFDMNGRTIGAMTPYQALLDEEQSANE